MRGPVLLVAGFAAAALMALMSLDPRAAADGWRAAFLLLAAPPIGAVALLLIARVVGADWDAALVPLLSAVPWLMPAAIPVVVGQALFHWPADHLHVWLSPPLFALRSFAALLFWSLLARALACDRVPRPGPMLLAHGLVVSAMGYDWLLGTAPAQPQSAAPMVLAVMQIGGGCAFVCAIGLGRPEQRRDLAYLLVAAALGLAYLLYIDFAIIWFGNLTEHVGWYLARRALPAAVMPGLALAIGLIAPILLVGLGRDDAPRRYAGTAALVALGFLAVWIVAGAGGWLGLLAAFLGVAAAGGVVRWRIA